MKLSFFVFSACFLLLFCIDTSLGSPTAQKNRSVISIKLEQQEILKSNIAFLEIQDAIADKKKNFLRERNYDGAEFTKHYYEAAHIGEEACSQIHTLAKIYGLMNQADDRYVVKVELLSKIKSRRNTLEYAIDYIESIQTTTKQPELIEYGERIKLEIRNLIKNFDSIKQKLA